MSNFGRTTESYNVHKVIDFINNKNKKEVTEYISYYFLKLNTSHQSLFWIPEEDKFEILNDFIIRARYVTKN